MKNLLGIDRYSDQDPGCQTNTAGCLLRIPTRSGSDCWKGSVQSTVGAWGVALLGCIHLVFTEDPGAKDSVQRCALASTWQL